MTQFTPCIPKRLPDDLLVSAARTACEQNPANAPAAYAMVSTDLILPPSHLAVLTQKYWSAKGVDLTVAFLEQTPADLRDRILSHANAWGKFANVRFRWSTTDPQVRITRSGDGYWSYLGTDILHIPRTQPTMCLSGFTKQTQESEFVRVVRHEFGHTLGCPHEHARRDIVRQIDPQKAIAYFWRTQGWNAEQVQQQVLTPLEDSALLGTPVADETSIMTYQLPGSITFDGQPIVGGADFSASDRAFAGQIYPLPTTEPPPPVEPPTKPPTNPPTKPDTGGIMGLLDLLKIVQALAPILDFFKSNPTLLPSILGILSKLGELLKARQLVARSQGAALAPLSTTRDDFRATLTGFVTWYKGIAGWTTTQIDDTAVNLCENALNTEWLFDLLWNVIGGRFQVTQADLAWAAQENQSVTV